MTNLHILLFLPLLTNSLAMDGCAHHAWRCGDVCVDGSAACKCGEATFSAGDHMWCCEDKPCTGKGELDWLGYYWGEWQGYSKIGAHCNGRALNLTEPCRGGCNFYKEDSSRNVNGVVRGYIPCNTSTKTITQCIKEHDVRDGKFDCKSRADEEPFATGFEKTSTLLNDLENILIACKGGRGHPGFTCSGYTGRHCLSMIYWCSSEVHSCDELAGKTATRNDN